MYTIDLPTVALIVALVGLISFLLGYTYGYEDGEDEARQCMPLEGVRKPAQPSSPAPATPLAEEASEALTGHYSEAERYLSQGSCWCGKDRRHEGPHASPIL